VENDWFPPGGFAPLSAGLGTHLNAIVLPTFCLGIFYMAVLSRMPVTQFKSGVVQGDVAALSRIKGVGKKTAERIILELKDKVGVTETWQDAAAGQVSAPAADAELALIALGYKQVDARKAVRKALDLDPTAATEALVRGALRLLQN